MKRHLKEVYSIQLPLRCHKLTLLATDVGCIIWRNFFPLLCLENGTFLERGWLIAMQGQFPIINVSPRGAQRDWFAFRNRNIYGANSLHRIETRTKIQVLHAVFLPIFLWLSNFQRNEQKYCFRHHGLYIHSSNKINYKTKEETC